jgi:hypothetical protein
MNAPWRPPHLLSFAHARIQNLIYRRLSHRRRDRSAFAMSFGIVDHRSTICCNLAIKLPCPGLKLARLLANIACWCIDSQHIVNIFCIRTSVMPEAPTTFFDLGCQKTMCFFCFRGCAHAANDLLEISHPHRNINRSSYAQAFGASELPLHSRLNEACASGPRERR